MRYPCRTVTYTSKYVPHRFTRVALASEAQKALPQQVINLIQQTTTAKAATSVFGRVASQQAAVAPGHEECEQAAAYLQQVKGTLARQALQAQPQSLLLGHQRLRLQVALVQVGVAAPISVQ